MAVKAGPGDQDMMAEINITPFTDVLLVLLIIFMIAASSVIQKGFGLDLPKALKASEVQETDIIIQITRENQISVGSRVLEMDQLLAYLRRLRENKKTDRVIIMADGKVKYSVVVKIMDIAKEADLTQIALATEGKKGGAEASPSPTP